VWLLFLHLSPMRGARGTKCGPVTTSQAVGGENIAAKTYIITGGNSGIGYASAMAFAKANARVVILPHSASSGEAAVQEIRKNTGNERVTAIQTDLSSFASVRASARQIQQLGIDRIDGLICNAGIGINPDGKMLTEDGFNYIIQVNFLSHFLLTELLLPMVRNAKGRVVVVASAFLPDGGCAFAKLPKGCISAEQLEQTAKTPTPGNATYYVSKYLQSIHASMIAHQESEQRTGVTSYSFAPGVFYSPLAKKVGTSLEFMRNYCKCKGPAVEESPTAGCPASTWCMLTTDQAAATPVYLSTTANALGSSGDRLNGPCSGCHGSHTPLNCRMAAPNVHSTIRQGAMGHYLNQLQRLNMHLTHNKSVHPEASVSAMASAKECAIDAPAPGALSPTARCAAGTLALGDNFVNAAGQGRLEDVQSSLRAGQDVDFPKPPKMDTALMLAAFFGHADVVKALLAAGADRKKLDIHRVDAYAHARDNTVPNKKAVVQLLSGKGRKLG
ncbi:MAG: hypothetical protein SGPRY_014279, partial [Prymnesium sp.]